MFSIQLFIAWLHLMKTSKKAKQKQEKQKKCNHPRTHFYTCRFVQAAQFTGNDESLEATRTSFAGAWHAHLRDGGENRVVHVALANQVNYPLRDRFDGAPVQLVVLSRLQKTRKECNVCQECVLH